MVHFTAAVYIRWTSTPQWYVLPPPLTTCAPTSNFTLKTNPLTRVHLDDFVSSYRADDRSQREETERFHRFTYQDLTQRGKANLDIF